MNQNFLEFLQGEIATIAPVSVRGQICEISGGVIRATGLSANAALGEQVQIEASDRSCQAEIVALSDQSVTLLPDGHAAGFRIGDPVRLEGETRIFPCNQWVGRIIDAYGKALDKGLLPNGQTPLAVNNIAPPAVQRRRLGERLSTGLAAFDTILPIVRGQRIGLFAGAGVGKSTLLGQLATGLDSDIAVIALIGERGREVLEFVEEIMGEAGMRRAVVVAATSDQSAIARRRCLLTAMTVAEFFRDQGQHVLFLADSVTRFAEAHREIALAAGESASLRGFPPSTAHLLMSLAERAGPGPVSTIGDITAVFSVLVSGSDMDEPVADILRGTLDGHVVLNRDIAERGRFPAIDVLKSVSRSLPSAANASENEMIRSARQIFATYERSELMVQSGLYTPGTDPEIDRALRIWPRLDRLIGEKIPEGCTVAFDRLQRSLGMVDPR